MRSIRSELLRVFLGVIGILAFAGLLFLLLHSYVVDGYKSQTDTTLKEYQLLKVADNLTTTYNNSFLGNADDTTAVNLKLNSARSSITRMTSYLNTAIVNNQSKAAFSGLKTTLAALLNAISQSEMALSQGDLSNYNNNRQQITKLYISVQQNDATLINSQLTYTNSISARLSRTYLDSEIFGGGALLLVTIFCIIYVFRFSVRFTRPLSELTSVALQISDGATNVPIKPTLLNRTDEIGSMASSFYIMLEKLKANLAQITEQKTEVEKQVIERTVELTQEEARLKSSVDSLSLGYIMTDSERQTILINEAAEFILSYQITNDGISQPDKKFSKGNWTSGDFERLFKSSFSFKDSLTKVMKEKQSIQRNDIEYNGRVLRIFITPVVENSKAIGTVILLEDITEEKVVERSKDEFFSIASHELRTPLTAIRGNSDMIRQFYAKKLKDPDFSQMVDDIHTSSVRLISFVNDFLDVSRLEQGKLQLVLESFDAALVIEEIIADMKTLALEKHNQLVF